MRISHAACAALAFWCLGSSASCAADTIRPPMKKDKPPESKEVWPDLAGMSGWGFITQKGKTFVITGHPHWEAIGEFRPDGKVWIQWTLNSDGKVAPSIYELRAGKLMAGQWGWQGDCTILPTGTMTGNVHDDTFGFGGKP